MSRWPLAAVLVLAAASLAHAHPYAFGVAEWRPGREAVLTLRLPLGANAPAPVVPGGCEVHDVEREFDGAQRIQWRVRCPETLLGPVGFEGLGPIQVHLRTLPDGLAGTLDRTSPTLSADHGYVRLGIVHIAAGWDHLLFVLGLLLLALRHEGKARLRRAAWLVSAFTLGHSLSLALAALGVAEVRALWVELVVAASLVLVGREAIAGKDGLTERFPFVVSGAFGVVHGLAFSSALSLAGLPTGEKLAALFGFNVGVELAQLAALLLAALVFFALRRAGAGERHVRVGAAYAVGIGGAYAFLMVATGLT